jgi:hypothetical protein
MLKPNPQPVPQLKLAVPLPLELSDIIVKVWLVVESPQPWVCDLTVAVPEPLELRVTSTRSVATPHPLSPWMSVICHGPVKSDLVIVPVALLSCAVEKIVTRHNTPRNTSRICGRNVLEFLVSGSRLMMRFIFSPCFSPEEPPLTDDRPWLEFGLAALGDPVIS